MTRWWSCAVAAALAGLVALAGLIGCDNGEASPDWSRMIKQPKLLPYGTTGLFADQRAMRPPPTGTIPQGWITDPAIRAGRGPSGDVEAIPLPMTRELLERGRARFDIVCATCHGVAGDGDSPVARAMERRRPPSLHEPRILALTPGAVYRVIASGYGLMPSYAAMLAPADRWAVVAYLRTLELSWTARLDALPASVRDDATRRLP